MVNELVVSLANNKTDHRKVMRLIGVEENQMPKKRSQLSVAISHITAVIKTRTTTKIDTKTVAIVVTVEIAEIKVARITSVATINVGVVLGK